jgi:hypothetical protein
VLSGGIFSTIGASAWQGIRENARYDRGTRSRRVRTRRGSTGQSIMTVFSLIIARTWDVMMELLITGKGE